MKFNLIIVKFIKIKNKILKKEGVSATFNEIVNNRVDSLIVSI